MHISFSSNYYKYIHLSDIPKYYEILRKNFKKEQNDINF